MNKSNVWLRKEKSIDIGIDHNAEDNFYWNPSITWHKKELFVSYRGYRKDANSFRSYTSPLVVGKLKDDKLVEYKELMPQNVPDYVKECGVEDVRIWSDGENLYGIGVVLSQFESENQNPRVRKRLNVRLAEIKINYDNATYDFIEDFGQPIGFPEKNWSPIEGRPHEYMYAVDKIYSYGVIKLTTNVATVDHRIIHNGTPLVKIDGGYIALIHQRTRLANRTGCYPNAFIKYNEDLVPVESTDWFVFDDYKDEEVQFMAGAVMLDKETLGITVGLDRITARRPALYKSLLYKVKLKDIDWQPYKPTPLFHGVYRQGDK